MGNTTINNFVAERISKELGDKILSKTLKPIGNDNNLYVSNNGDDNNADGTQLKPFKTLPACLEFARKNYFNWSDKSINIKFLTDYTANRWIVIRPTATMGTGSVYTSWVIDGEGHNVVLNGCVESNSASTYLKNVTVSDEVGNSRALINCIEHGKVLFDDNVTLKITSSVNSTVLAASSYGEIYIEKPISIISNDTSIKYVLYASRYGKINNTKGININGNLTVNDAFIVINELGLYIGLSQIATTGTVTGKRYRVLTNGVINTGGKGTLYFPGSIDGEVSTGGQYV